MQANIAVGGQRTLANERSQFAGRTTTGEIHLKESILGVEHARRASDVLARVASDGRYAQRVASNDDRRRESFDSNGAVKLRQASPKLCSCPQRTGGA